MTAPRREETVLNQPEAAADSDARLRAEAARLLAGRVDGDRQRLERDIRRWRMRSQDHARVWETAERLWRATGGDAVLAHRPAPPRRTAWVVTGATALAVTVALAIASPALLHRSGDIRTGVGELRQQRLADGSLVDLDARSALDVAEGPGRGAVLRKGRAYFAVAKDPARPFHVRADAVDVEVTGTGFSVARRADGIEVALAEGAVRVHAGGRTQALQPGQRLRVSSSGAMTLGEVAIDAVGAWRDGQLIVENTRIDEVVDQLRPHLKGLVMAPPASLAAQRVSGVFDLRDPQAALASAVAPFGGAVDHPLPGITTIVEK